MRKNSQLTDTILMSLEKSIDGLVRFEDFSYNTHIYAQGSDRPLKKNALAQALHRLRLKGYIDKEYYEGRLILKLTKKGLDQAILRKVLNSDKWDGKWRVVVFDIPEENRKIRNAFRSRLKLWKFESHQKSVWVSRKDILKEVKDLVKELGIKKWVTIFEADKVDD